MDLIFFLQNISHFVQAPVYNDEIDEKCQCLIHAYNDLLVNESMSVKKTAEN